MVGCSEPVWRRAGEQTGATPQPSPVALTLAERLNAESALFLLCRFSLPHNGKQVFHVETGPEPREPTSGGDTRTGRRARHFKTGSGLKLSALYPPTGDFAFLQNAVGETTLGVHRGPPVGFGASCII